MQYVPSVMLKLKLPTTYCTLLHDKQTLAMTKLVPQPTGPQHLSEVPNFAHDYLMRSHHMMGGKN